MLVKGQLLKFSRPSDNALQNLEKGQLFCQHYAAYNDPLNSGRGYPAGFQTATGSPSDTWPL